MDGHSYIVKMGEHIGNQSESQELEFVNIIILLVLTESSAIGWDTFYLRIWDLEHTLPDCNKLSPTSGYPTMESCFSTLKMSEHRGTLSESQELEFVNTIILLVWT